MRQYTSRSARQQPEFDDVVQNLEGEQEEEYFVTDDFFRREQADDDERVKNVFNLTKNTTFSIIVSIPPVGGVGMSHV